MIITIDGPAGSGKSTAARKLAARLEVPYLDTGAMYRAIAYQALAAGVDLLDADALEAMARECTLELDCGPTHTRVRVNEHDVTEAIRSMAVSRATTPIARHQGIRALLVEKQRSLGRQLASFVTEGRDQGSVVFPHADVRFVVDADLEQRAERRHREMAADGEEVELDDVRANLASRDATDAKQWAALLEPGEAIRIDTTHMTIAEVVTLLASHVRRRVEANAT